MGGGGTLKFMGKGKRPPPPGNIPWIGGTDVGKAAAAAPASGTPLPRCSRSCWTRWICCMSWGFFNRSSAVLEQSKGINKEEKGINRRKDLRGGEMGNAGIGGAGDFVGSFVSTFVAVFIVGA